MNERTICVYCSSSNSVAPIYFTAARALGTAMADRGYALVYGGTKVGLMGALADSVLARDGKVVGVIPEALQARGIAHDGLTELIVTPDMRRRKATMEERASAFVGLPGGFGTLEEIFECLTLKQLEYHQKPIALLNVGGFYDPLIGLMEHIYQQNFAKPEYRQLYHVAREGQEVLDYFDGYQPPTSRINKWA